MHRLVGQHLTNWPFMPNISRDWSALQLNPLISEQLSYDRNVQLQLLNQHLPMLNPDQCSAYDLITSSVQNGQADIFFDNGPGGTGKTFLYNVVCNKLRGDGILFRELHHRGLHHFSWGQST